MGGVGKSFLMLDLGIRVAAGRSLLGGTNCLGGELQNDGNKAVFITAEDSRNAVHRRLNSLVHQSEIKKLDDNLMLIPMSDCGGTQAFLINRGGEYYMTPFWEDVCSEVIRVEAEILMIDPLQAFVQADITSDPAAAQCYWSAVSQLSSESGASILTSHHMRKDNNIDGVATARNAIRGTSALVDGCRWAYALWPSSPDEIKKINRAFGEEYNLLDVVHGAVVKSNEFGNGNPSTYLRDKHSGLLLDKTREIADILGEIAVLTQEQINEIFFEVSRRWDNEEPFSHSPNARDRFLGKYICESYDFDYETAKVYVERWLKNRNLVLEKHPSIPRAKGVRRRETPSV